MLSRSQSERSKRVSASVRRVWEVRQVCSCLRCVSPAHQQEEKPDTPPIASDVTQVRPQRQVGAARVCHMYIN